MSRTDFSRRDLSTEPTVELGLRRWPPPAFSSRPYPLLLPYQHPQLLAGRESELATLERLLKLPVAILGLHAPSGVGKSSLLAAGLVPSLRDAGRPVAYVRHPHEPALAERLLSDLLTADSSGARPAITEHDPLGFDETMLAVRELAGQIPVLIIDQFEDLLHKPGARRSRAILGALLAATIRRRPGVDTAPCRWLLAYRQEYHGEICAWLGDVLADAELEGLTGDLGMLPHDLSGADRFHSTPLLPLATPSASGEPLENATRVFRSAIEKPLELVTSDGSPRYPWRFAEDGAERLARAFAEARLAFPDDPLTPELQVVLAHFLSQAHPAERGRPALIRVPPRPAEQIDRALEMHVRRALGAALVDGDPDVRQDRARILLALRELADEDGRRNDGLPAATLRRMIGDSDGEVLDRLASPAARLLTLRAASDDWCYVLAHDRLAAVVVGMTEAEEGATGRTASGDFLDGELLALRRFVALNIALHRIHEPQATRLPRGYFRRISAHADVLLWGDEQRAWWDACLRRRRSDRNRRRLRDGTIGTLLIAVVLLATSWARDKSAWNRRHTQLTSGEPGTALLALVELAADPEADLDDVRARWQRREAPIDVFEKGPAALPSEARAAMVLRAVELAQPIVDEQPEDLELVAVLVWALDAFPGRDPAHTEAARQLRRRLLTPLRKLRPTPPDDEIHRVELPAGDFEMGLGPGEGTPERVLQWRRHPVSISAFLMSRHEVTTGDFRRLVPGHATGDSLNAGPAVRVSWYAAYAYAAWLGGRLPTEAEWEYAAKAGCLYRYCDPAGRETTLDAVAWHRGNTHAETGEPAARAVGRRAPNPWGLYDMYGNAWEWTTDWYADYSPTPARDPWGPAAGTSRAIRGGGFWNDANLIHAAHRFSLPPGTAEPSLGFRIVWPLSSSPW